jgi:hypothetical protein
VVVTDLNVLRREHEQVGIGPELADLLDRIVRATAPTYPPAEYSPAGSWDRAALEDAMQDWVTYRLLARGDLTVLLASARSAEALRALLTRSFGQHLTNRRRRTSATNLFVRMVTTLRTDRTFLNVTAVGPVGEHGWTLTATPMTSPASPGTVGLLVKAAGMRSDSDLGVVRYGPYSLKSSPILRGPQLRAFLEFLLQESDGYVTTTELFHVMRHRFNLVELPAAEFDDTLTSPVPPVPATVETRTLARSVLSRLGLGDVRLLRLLSDHEGNARAAEAATGTSTAEFRAALERMHALIAEYADSFDEAVAVHRVVVESLYEEGEES